MEELDEHERLERCMHCSRGAERHKQVMQSLPGDCGVALAEVQSAAEEDEEPDVEELDERLERELRDVQSQLTAAQKALDPIISEHSVMVGHTSEQLACKPRS